MADVLAMDAHDDLLARVEVAVLVALDFYYFKVAELQVWREQQELTARGVRHVTRRSGEIQGK